MDFDDYVAARYGRLIEHAVLLGCAEGEAGTQVDRVLLDQRRAIRRAEDPDPVVYAALDRAISRTPERPGRSGPLLVLAAVGVVVAVAVVLTYRPPPEPMPSLFGLDAIAAEQLLEAKGYDVLVRPVRACEPQGQVLGSEPQTGQPVGRGATVTVRAAVPSDLFCNGQYPTRSDAWEFVAFALGGAAPRFARSVHLVVDRGETTTFTHDQALDRERWEQALSPLVEAAQQSAPTSTGMPALLVSSQVPPRDWCGIPRPAAAGERVALRLEVDARPPNSRAGCPLTVDLYRSSGLIDAVVVYTPKSQPEQGLAIDPAGLRPADPGD